MDKGFLLLDQILDPIFQKCLELLKNIVLDSPMSNLVILKN